MMVAPDDQRGLRIFGFPLHIRPGFALLVILVVLINPGPIGVWLAAGIGGFTLLHELGHAFAARATGAQAEISLDFLAGYASFRPTRRLKPWERAGISFAGPAIQIATGVAILAAMGVHPLDRDDITSSDAAYALWWAGPMIGLFNLLPVLPLDGGNIVTAALEKLWPARARTFMVYASLAVTLGGGVYLFTHERLRPLSTFLVFLVLVQMQMLSATRPQGTHVARAEVERAGARAEAAAWRTGQPVPLPQGLQLSPWFDAHLALRRGDREGARQILVQSLATPSAATWLPPDGAPPAALAELLALLDEPLPTGNPYGEMVLAGVLARAGRFERAAHYAAALHSRQPSAGAALVVARSAAALGDTATAMGWLEVAAATSNHPEWLAHAIDTADEFRAMRDLPALQALRDDLVDA